MTGGERRKEDCSLSRTKKEYVLLVQKNEYKQKNQISSALVGT